MNRMSSSTLFCVLCHLLYQHVMCTCISESKEVLLNYTGSLTEHSGAIRFECNTIGLFSDCSAEFLVNGVTFDHFKSTNNSCHDKDGPCDEDVCHCNDTCISFQWNFMYSVNNFPILTPFSCVGRILRSKKHYKVESFLRFNSNDSSVTYLCENITLISAGAATTPTFTATTDLSNSTNISVTIGVVAAVIVMCILVTLVIIFWFRHKQKARRSTEDKTTKTMDLFSPEKNNSTSFIDVNRNSDQAANITSDIVVRQHPTSPCERTSKGSRSSDNSRSSQLSTDPILKPTSDMSSASRSTTRTSVAAKRDTPNVESKHISGAKLYSHIDSSEGGDKLRDGAE